MSSTQGDRDPPILLANASYYGTLAATRALGRAGIAVTVADREWLAPARWSRYATRVERAPSVEEPELFVEWLLDFGRRAPRHVLYPTSDDAAWLYSLHREALAEHFDMFQPSSEALFRLLNKRALFTVCHELGLEVAHSYFPETAAELEAVGARAAFPLLIKPATQVLLQPHGKGVVVRERGALASLYAKFRATHRPHPTLLAHFPGADLPLLQTYHAEAASAIYSVAGFADRGGSRIVARAARKVLQRPRKLGIGLCFEEEELRPALLEGIARLCAMTGYHGVFEAEFIEAGGRFLLIDFNPRFYSQMAFECARDLPLPRIVYEAALGRDDALSSTVAAKPRAPGDMVYTHWLVFELLTRGQRLTGRMSREETARWQRWKRAHRGRIVDAVRDSSDVMPWLVDTIATVRHWVRYPRSFVRTMLLDQ